MLGTHLSPEAQTHRLLHQRLDWEAPVTGAFTMASQWHINHTRWLRSNLRWRARLRLSPDNILSLSLHSGQQRDR